MNLQRSRIHVLVVEDEPDIRDALSEALSAAGHFVAVARNGEHGLRILQHGNFAPCVVVLDLTMPIMGGIELLEHLAASPLRASVRVVVLSAAPSASEAWRFSTVSHVIAKPADLEQLLAAVRGDDPFGAP